MSGPRRSSTSVYSRRALRIGFGVFAFLEAAAIVSVVHVAVGRWQVTVAVAVLFAIVIGASFGYSIRRDRQATDPGPSLEAATSESDLDSRGEPAWSQLPAPGSETVLRVKGVEVTVGHQRILDIEDLAVREGEFVALAGRNGSGKTTLLRAVGSLIPYRGEIVTSAPIGFMPDRPALYPRLTGAEHLALVMGMRGRPRDSRRAAASELLRRLDLTDAADRRVRGWSLGMRRKLSLALAMCGEPSLLLLDEPGDALDDEAFAELGKVLREHVGRGGAAIVATHDHRIFPSAHRVVTIDQGRVADAQGLA